ncbi:AlpA family phage regulatory protein [Brevundimonas sp.]|uniref:helix-turn-helix transcriptional regulator n=1 Tax=Brevundimonas sp. TaxID=1871086 RepID=UPI0028AFAAB5|nr:AlpA family phage regulatory protein [Brevundimonas sp.]
MNFRVDGESIDSGGPEDRLLPWRRVQDIAGISRSTAWRMQRIGEFPTPVTVSPGRVGWWESELTAWKGARGTTRALVPPSRPRLPGMSRRTPGRSALAASNAGCEREEMSESPVKGAARRSDRKRRALAVHVDQIDFGF